MSSRAQPVSWRPLATSPVVMLVVVGTLSSLALAIIQLTGPQDRGASFAGVACATILSTGLVALWGPMLVRSRGLRQVIRLRRVPADTPARKLRRGELDAPFSWAKPARLSVGDLVLVKASESIPRDGEVVQGVALVDESAVTGESAPVIREPGGERGSVIGGTRVLSDWLILRVTADVGQGFLERVRQAATSARRRMSNSERTLTLCLAAFALLLLCLTALPFLAHMDALARAAGSAGAASVLVALLFSVLPFASASLIAPVTVRGMDELARRNVLALSGRAVEAAGEVDTLILDKTGTITLGNREVAEFDPATGVTAQELAEAAQLASLADTTPEGRSVVVFAKRRFGLRGRSLTELRGKLIPFSASSRMSGIDLPGRRIRKGASDAIQREVEEAGGSLPPDVGARVALVASSGGTPLLVAEDSRILGVIGLRDTLKPGVRERFAELRELGIRTILSTGDGEMTAAAVAAEAGLDGFLAQATAESKLELVRREQAAGHKVAMIGDGTNDAPALAQADLAVVMGTGNRLAREAGNMVDLDADPTKVPDIVVTGRRMLALRRRILSLAIAADLGKALVLWMTVTALAFPALRGLNILAMASVPSVILAGLLFSALATASVLGLACLTPRLTPRPRPDLWPWAFALAGFAASWIVVKLLEWLLP